MSVPLHIVLVNQFYPPEGWGGTATYTHTMATACVALGHDVTVITSCSGASEVREVMDGAQVIRLPRVNLPWRLLHAPILGPYVRTLRHILYSGLVARALLALRRRQPIDVVEVPEINAEGLLYGWIPAVRGRKRAPVVVRCMCPHLLLQQGHVRGDAPIDYSVAWLLERLMIHRADCVTAPSAFLADCIAASCGLDAQEIVQIPHPAPPECSAAGKSARTRRESSDPITVLYAGRLDRTKGAFTLARAIPNLVARVPDIRVWFAGPSVAMPDSRESAKILQEILERTGCSDRVRFLGRQDKSSLQALRHQADICVVPSQDIPEVFPYTAIEAMTAGCAVVASCIGGIPDLIEHGVSGLLFEPGDERDLTDSLVAVALDAERREDLGMAGRRRVEEICDPLRVAAATLNVYRSVLPA